MQLLDMGLHISHCDCISEHSGNCAFADRTTFCWPSCVISRHSAPRCLANAGTMTEQKVMCLEHAASPRQSCFPQWLCSGGGCHHTECLHPLAVGFCLHANCNSCGPVPVSTSIVAARQIGHTELGQHNALCSPEVADPSESTRGWASDPTLIVRATATCLSRQDQLQASRDSNIWVAHLCVVHAHGDAGPVEVEHRVLLRLAAVLRLEMHRQLAGPLHDEVGRPVLIAVSVPADQWYYLVRALTRMRSSMCAKLL